MRTLRIVLIVLVTLAIVAGALFLWATTPAYAHSWYSSECCSGDDCHPIDAALVRETAEGYLVQPFDKMDAAEFIRFDDKRIQKSRDLDYHGCVWAKRPRCLYVPPSSF